MGEFFKILSHFWVIFPSEDETTPSTMSIMGIFLNSKQGNACWMCTYIVKVKVPFDWVVASLFLDYQTKPLRFF